MKISIFSERAWIHLKNILNKLYKYIKNPPMIIRALASKGFLNWLPDKPFLILCYAARVGKKLDLTNPYTFNEKIQWLKLYDRKPEYTQMVDKYEVKRLVADAIAEDFVIPTLGIWDNFDDIDFDALPNQFVLKCTHDCGGLVICRDKKTLDVKAARKKIERSLKRNYYYNCREWPYKNVPPRIIAEQYMQDGDNANLPVYKIFNFSGEPRIIQVVQDDKTPHETIDYFDTQWQLLEMRQNFPNSNVPMPRPKQLDEMLEIARKLSIGFPFIRTDIYEINGKLYFSEYTFYSDAGFAKFTPDCWDEILGSWVEIPGIDNGQDNTQRDMLYREF